jgi:N-methylhydantoinase A
VLRTVDVRYRRQGYELNVPYDVQCPAATIDAFHQLHQQRYGFSDSGKQVEIVNLRLRMVASGEPYSPQQQQPRQGDGVGAHYATREVYFEGNFLPTRLYGREALLAGDRIEGPAMITEYTSATLLPPDCCANVDAFANLVITFTKETA